MREKWTPEILRIVGITPIKRPESFGLLLSKPFAFHFLSDFRLKLACRNWLHILKWNFWIFFALNFLAARNFRHAIVDEHNPAHQLRFVKFLRTNSACSPYWLLSLKPTKPLKISGWKMKCLSKWSFFRAHVNIRLGILEVSSSSNPSLPWLFFQQPYGVDWSLSCTDGPPPRFVK